MVAVVAVVVVVVVVVNASSRLGKAVRAVAAAAAAAAAAARNSNKWGMWWLLLSLLLLLLLLLLLRLCGCSSTSPLAARCKQAFMVTFDQNFSQFYGWVGRRVMRGGSCAALSRELLTNTFLSFLVCEAVRVQRSRRCSSVASACRQQPAADAKKPMST